MNIKQLIQAEIEGKAAIAKAKKEGRDLMAIAERTPEQAARLTAVFRELDALEAAQAGIEQDLVNARRLQDDQRAQATNIEVGVDRATLQPWGPQVATSAPAYRQREAEHIALGNFALAVRAAGMGHGLDPRLQAAATGGGTQSDSNLGFAVPMEVAPGIERDMFATGDVLSRCDVRTIGGNTIAYNVIDQTSRADGSRQGGVLGY